MAITYPRLLPSFIDDAITCGFDIAESVSQSRTLGNEPLATQRADPAWVFSITTEPLSRVQGAELKAWKESLKGGAKSFLAHDYERPDPLNYPDGVTSLTRAGGGAFDGTAKVAALATNSLTVGAAAGFLPASYVVKAGDRVGLVTAGAPTRYSVHTVLEDATASVGGVVTLNIYPFIQTARFAIGDTVNLVKPLAEFILDPSSWAYEASGGDPASASFGGRGRSYP